MPKRLFSFLFILISSFFFISNPSFAQISDTVGVVDTLRVGNVTAYPGFKVCVPLYAFNDEHLGAFVIPLEFSSTDISCDSISFVGTRAASATMKSDSSSRGTDIKNDEKRVTAWAVWFTGDLSPGEGIVANLWFTVDSSALPQIVEFDTFSTLDPPVYLDFTYPWAVDMIPAFAKGGITIKQINLPPQIQPIEDQYVNEGDTLLINIQASDPEEDLVAISILNKPVGAVFADSGNGKATFRWIPPYTGSWSSENSPYTVTFVASDLDTTSSEDVVINVADKDSLGEDYVLEIGADTGLFSEVITLPVKLTNPDSIGAMNLLLHFDQTAVSLLSVSKLNTRISNWEYFQYRIDQPEAGDVQILALADIPDPVTTPALPPGEGVIANLIFQIVINPCPLSPSSFIGYKFIDSTSNTFSGSLGQKFIGQNDIEYREGYILIQCSDDVSEEGGNSILPEVYELSQNYPNPFNPTTEIRFALPEETKVSLAIYNIMGQVVNKLVNENLKAGRYKVVWEGKDSAGNRVSSGIYFYRLETASFSQTKKMIMVK